RIAPRARHHHARPRAPLNPRGLRSRGEAPQGGGDCARAPAHRAACALFHVGARLQAAADPRDRDDASRRLSWWHDGESLQSSVSGDVALNISLTAVNSVLAVVTLPVITNLAIGYFAPDQPGLGLQVAKALEVFAI